MLLTYVDSAERLTMRLEIGKLVIVFEAFLDKKVVNMMKLFTCFSSF